MSVLSEERIAPANGIELAYQEAGDPNGEPLILVMGLATQMLAWDEDFCALLVERGFRVVRFDNRDIGRSTKIDSAGLPGRADMLLGRRSTAPYFLSDMAADTVGLMDHMGIESAHVAGVSMGGMIAQTMAIEHPERARSLTSIMSSTGNRWVARPSWRAVRALLATPPEGREAAIDHSVKVFRTIGSPGYPMDEARFREMVGTAYDRSHARAGVARQMHAISASGDRTPQLRKLRLPSTVMHGAADPLLRPSAGRATARAIPGSHLRLFDGMGHDLPQPLWPELVGEITSVAARAGADVHASAPA